MQKTALVTLIALSCALFGASAGSAALKKEYKLNCNVTENTIWGQGTAYFCRLVKERTNGAVNIKPYYSAQLISGKQTNELLMLRNGTIDFSFAGLGNWSTTLPATRLFNLPWFIASAGEPMKALEVITHGKAGQMLADQIAKVGVTVVGWGYQAPRQIHAKFPIRNPDDLKGQKIRYVSSPLYKDIFEDLGANGININWSEALTAYQQGMVDAGENPYNTIIAYRVYEFHKYITEWNYSCTANAFVANNRVWNSFDDDTKKILRECAEEAGILTAKLNLLGMDDGSAYKWLKERNLLPTDENTIPTDPYKLLKDNGVTVIHLTHDEIMAFRKATKRAFEKHAVQVGLDLVKAAEEDMKAAGLKVDPVE